MAHRPLKTYLKPSGNIAKELFREKKAIFQHGIKHRKLPHARENNGLFLNYQAVPKIQLEIGCN